jgi:hypothetical protein
VHLWTCSIFIVFEVGCIQAGSRAPILSIKWETRTLSLRKRSGGLGFTSPLWRAEGQIYLSFIRCTN